MNKIECEISNWSKLFWITIGGIVTPLTLGAAFMYFYMFFFERECYYTRRNLLVYLLHNSLPQPEKFESKFEKSICGFLWSFEDYHLYLWWNGDVSLHLKENDCILSSFNSRGLDRRRYNKIKNILLQEVEKYKK